MRIALMLPNWVGDVAMVTPALRMLRRHFGEAAQLIGLLPSHLHPVLNGAPWLNELLAVDQRLTRPDRRLGPPPPRR